LRFVDEGVTRRIGEYRDRIVDVRIVSATNVVLDECVRRGTFREDLLARLGVLTLSMPPLAAHADDIPEITEHILQAKCREAGVSARPLTDQDMERLIA